MNIILGATGQVGSAIVNNLIDKGPSFYPIDLQFDMISPFNVAKFVADKIEQEIEPFELIEIVGPKKYSPRTINQLMGEALNKKIRMHRIPENKWHETMKSLGFSDDAATNFIAMTQVVANRKAQPERKG